jgi:protein-tyrosine phosphatase
MKESKQNIIDIHTHILAGIDDGSDSIEASINQLKIMADCGVTDVICTPHFITNFYENGLNKRTHAAQKLSKAMEKAKVSIRIHLGAEVLLDSKSLENIKVEKLNIQGTDYVLVESEMSAFPADFTEILYYLVKAGYKPILAHPERYNEVKKNPNIIEEFLHRNVLMQINSGSLFGDYGKEAEKAAWHLLHNGWAHFLASDNHCRKDDYNLILARDLIKTKIDTYTAELLTINNPKKLLNNERIEIFYLSYSYKQKRKSIFGKILEHFTG